MPMNLAPMIRQRFFDASGNPLAGGKLYTYQAGTSTPQPTYTDATGGAPNTNPVILDANGEGNVWLDPALSYKFILTDANGVARWTVDNVVGLLAPQAVATAAIQDGAVTTDKLASEAVTSAKLKASASNDIDRAVTTNHVRDGAITSVKLQNDAAVDANRAVTTNHIRDGAITSAKLQNDAAVDANRAVTTNHIRDGAITQAKRAPLAYAASSAVTGTTASASYTTANITGLSVTIQTTGRPVWVGLVAGGGGNASKINMFGAGTTINSLIAIHDGSSFISEYQMALQAANGGSNLVEEIPVSAICTVDVPTAGSKTYHIEYRLTSGTSLGIYNAKLVAFEL